MEAGIFGSKFFRVSNAPNFPARRHYRRAVLLRSPDMTALYTRRSARGICASILSGRGTEDEHETLYLSRPERYCAIARRLAARPKENDEERSEADVLASKF